MFRRIDDFLTEWEHESASTARVLRALTDESLGFTAPGVRSIGRLAGHIVETLTEMPGTAGLSVGEEPEEDAAGRDAAAVAEAYERNAAQVARAVREGWTDGLLPEPVPMYGQEWPRGTVLSILIKHEAHHRGQLTVLMRQAGLTVPGTYGPAREEWAAMGLPPME
jgi:uncharacterized damage-inducible protein DinB